MGIDSRELLIGRSSISCRQWVDSQRVSLEKSRALRDERLVPIDDKVPIEKSDRVPVPHVKSFLSIHTVVGSV